MRIVVKQITKFFIIGISAVLVDLIVYYFLSNFLGFTTDFAKACGFLTGAFYTFHLNKRWTWSNKEKVQKSLLVKFVVIYGISFIMNILINKYALVNIPEFVASFHIETIADQGFDVFAVKGNKFFAFFLATGSSAFFNFLGQKFYVFKGQTK